MCRTLKIGLGLGMWHSPSLGPGFRFHPQHEKRKIKKIGGTQVRRPMQPRAGHLVPLGTSIIFISCVKTMGGAG